MKITRSQLKSVIKEVIEESKLVQEGYSDKIKAIEFAIKHDSNFSDVVDEILDMGGVYSIHTLSDEVVDNLFNKIKRERIIDSDLLEIEESSEFEQELDEYDVDDKWDIVSDMDDEDYYIYEEESDGVKLMTEDEAREYASDAYGHFINGWDIKENDLVLNNMYNKSWTQDRGVDEEAYLLASEILLDYENATEEEAIDALTDALKAQINL